MGTTRRAAAQTLVDDAENPGGMTADTAMPTGEVVEFEDRIVEDVQTPADRVMSMISEVGEAGDTRAYVKVTRIDEGARHVWCKDYSVAQFEQGGYEMVRRQFGPGEYIIVLYGTMAGTKRFTIRTRATVEIGAVEADAASTPAVHGNSDLSAILTAMQESNRAMLEAINASKTPPVDPMAQMSQMFAMMEGMRKAMGLDNQPKQGSVIKDILESISAIREVQDVVSPPPVPETPMGMVTQMLPLIQTAMQARNQQPQQPQQPGRFPPIALQPNPTPPGAPAAAINLPTLPTPPENETVNPVAILALKAHLATLLQMGKEGVPAQDGADLLYEHLPDDFFTILAQPNWLDLLKMVTNANEVDGIKDWLLMARNRMLWMLQNGEAMEAGENMPDGWQPADAQAPAPIVS